MDDPDVRSRPLLLGHLMITVPAIAVIPLMVFWGLYMFGTSTLLYYICAGLAAAWQWYSIAILRWKERLRQKGFQECEIEEMQRRAGLLWLGASPVGLIALHTTIVAVCALRIGPWLVGRWFGWVLPFVGNSSTGFTAYSDYYLQHLEFASILPALAIGYIVCKYWQKGFATWAWTLPTLVLSYKLLTFTDPRASIFGSHPWSSFSYYFEIERLAPTFSDLRGSDPVRLVQQMTVVAPFYSGMAYSLGALAKNHNVLERIISSLSTEPEPEMFGPEEMGVEAAVDGNEEPAHEGNNVEGANRC